jgi:Ser/Thr protein kinase RdoA (MazF antagonist)
MQLPQRILGQAVPVIAEHLAGEDRAQFVQQVAALTPEMEHAFAGLPEQHIHGDCHMGNVILGDAGVVGIIDLDHLPVGPRVYDLGYVLADMVKWRIAALHETERWLALAPRLIAGYEQVNPLSEQEKESLWYVLLAVQLLFAEFYASTQDDAGVRLNVAAFTWFADHRDEICQRFMGTLDDTF